jgi:hypothetical protein
MSYSAFGWRAAAVAATLFFGLANSSSAARLTPESHEVRGAVERAIGYLSSDKGSYDRIGGKALIGLVYVKTGADARHPRVAEAVAAIQGIVHDRKVADGQLPVYDTGLCLIFLLTLDSAKYTPEIDALLAYLQSIQKPHGGWGYLEKPTGDTSMTQYAVLGSWEATQAGFRIPREMIEGVADWLVRTQDPSGGFGYQGNVSESNAQVRQKPVRLSLSTAGLGSVYVCAQLLGVNERIDPSNELPPVVMEVKDRGADAKGGALKVSPSRIRAAQALGNAWMTANYRIDPEKWTFYYLYALERYWSFRESVEGEKKHGWYSEGAHYLIRIQNQNGSWSSKDEKEGATPVNTAFGALFLLRSSKKSIQHAYVYRASTLVGGRGLPHDLSRVALHKGNVVSQPSAGEAASRLDCLVLASDPGYAQALEVLNFLPATESKALVDKEGAKLRDLAVAAASAQVRKAAVRVLAESDDLEQVPTLIGKLDDADLAVVREANDGLRRLSRKLTGFDLAEQPSPAQRQALIEKWKAWYLAIYPNAEFPN